MRSIVILLAAFAAAPAAPVFGQQPLVSGDRSVERTAGFSWHSPASASLGSTTHRRVYLTGVRGEWLLHALGPLAIAYGVELVPLAIVERTGPNSQTCRWTGRNLICRIDRSARVAVGAGGSPIGLKLYFNRAGWTRAFASGSGGALLFSSHVPVHTSSRANFTFEYGGGFEFVKPNGDAVTFGYKFHHISNGGTRRVNPGLDSNILYIGLLKRHSR